MVEHIEVPFKKFRYYGDPIEPRCLQNLAQLPNVSHSIPNTVYIVNQTSQKNVAGHT